MAQTCQFGDAVIESGQLAKEPVKLLLDWRPPSSVSLNNYGLRLPHAEIFSMFRAESSNIQRKRRSIGPLMTLSVPGYFRR